MPLTTKQLRDALALQLGSVVVYFSTTAAGSTTTITSSDVGGFPPDEFEGTYPLILTGTESVKWRLCTTYASSTGVFTVTPALAGAPGSAVNVEVHSIRPDIYKLALNDAIKQCYPMLFVPMRNWGGIIADSAKKSYQYPRGMVDITRVSFELTNSRVYYDLFTRANSTTAPGTAASGQTYTVVAGTFGISSNKLYSVTDADADLMVVETSQKDGFFQATVSGTLNSATVYRLPDLIFRYSSSNTYLVVQLKNGSVDLRKNDGGTESSLATGTVTTSNGVDYVVRVQYIGSRIAVWVDEVELIDYELLGTDLKYAAFTSVGFRLSKGGAPGTNARWDDAKFHKVVELYERPDWEVSPDKTFFSLDRNGSLSPVITSDYLFVVEGKKYLTALTADSTFGTLAADGTALVELVLLTGQTDLLLSAAKYNIYRRLASPLMTRYKEARDEFNVQAQAAYAEYLDQRNRFGMPMPIAPIRHPGWGWD